MVLKFEYADRKYEIEFNGFNIIDIIGDSAVGKSLMCEDLNRSEYSYKIGDAIVLSIADYRTYKSFLKNDDNYKKYKFIVIDNADILVDDEISQIIETKPKNYWILIGRVIPNCVPSMTCVGVLKKRKGVIGIDYDNIF